MIYINWISNFLEPLSNPNPSDIYYIIFAEQRRRNKKHSGQCWCLCCGKPLPSGCVRGNGGNTERGLEGTQSQTRAPLNAAGTEHRIPSECSGREYTQLIYPQSNWCQIWFSLCCNDRKTWIHVIEVVVVFLWYFLWVQCTSEQLFYVCILHDMTSTSNLMVCQNVFFC